MVYDEMADPNDPLSEPFQNGVLERGRRLEALRPLVPTDADAAQQFQALVAEQLKAYEHLVKATQRFPPGNEENPAETFRRGMAREIQKLRDDADWSRSKSR